MYLEIVTPDKTYFQGEVDQATFPGTDGSFQILNNHAPLISTLGEGDMSYTKIREMDQKKEDEQILTVKGGVVEVLNNRIIVLAEAIEEE